MHTNRHTVVHLSYNSLSQVGNGGDADSAAIIITVTRKEHETHVHHRTNYAHVETTPRQKKDRTKQRYRGNSCIHVSVILVVPLARSHGQKS